MDVHGDYYSVLFDGRRACNLAPDGVSLAEFATPVPCPTMPCFGGEDFQTLFIYQCPPWPQRGRA
ncbi:MAG: SMP-30/gluconolactonase/LRE family protein [Burkholderiaceae bacterium]